MDKNKKDWSVKSHLTVGTLFLFITIFVYFITKTEIHPLDKAKWYALLTLALILSIFLIFKGLTDKEPDK